MTATWTTKGNREISTDVATVRMIYRCSVKSCRATKTIEYTVTTTIQYVNGRQILAPHHQFTDDGFSSSVLPETILCPACRNWTMNGKAVHGIVTNHECDPACTSARGFNCECSCGGKNHGRDYQGSN